MAYLVSCYPAISHTFIDREIQSVRLRGIDVETISLRATAPGQLLTEHDRREFAATWVVLPPSLPRLALAHLSGLVRSPRRYLSVLRRALGLGRPGLKGFVWRVFYFVEAGLVAQRLRARGITHVHAHFANSASWVALLAAELAGATWSFTMHGPSEFDDITEFALAEKVDRAAYVACIGDFARSQLMRITPPQQWNRLGVVRCGVDPGRFTPADAGLVASSPGQTRLLAVGRLMADKGQRVLIEAVADLVERGWNGQLTIVGEGPDHALLQRAVDDAGLAARVDFAGAIGQDELPGYYQRADIFVLSSFAEGIPVVLMEAMASGLPVIAPWVMGIGELVDASVGRLVAPARPDQLADAIAKLDGDADLRRSLGQAGAARVQEQFTHPQVVGPLVDVFTRLAS